MGLLEEDEEYLNQKGYRWEYHPVGAEGVLVIRDFPIDAVRYDRAVTDLLIQIPSGYNMACLDMYYCDPTVLFKDGQYPPQSLCFVMHLGKQWQRFSRHLPPNSWRAGIDRLPGFMALITQELCPRQ